MDCIKSFILEMKHRYERNDGREDFKTMPYKILIIDELNDLIGINKDIDAKPTKLSQKTREARIHLVLTMQRPDSKVFSGTLRSTIPSRIALRVQKSTESKIILDETGTEKLLGKDDCSLSS